MSSLPGIRALAFVLFGCWIGKSGEAVGRLALKYAFGAIVVEAILATGQYLHTQGIALAILESQYRWDIWTQASYSEHYIITGRSIGSFINPNELGYWSIIAFWLSMLALRGWSRGCGVSMALLTLFLSQSRGSMLALAGSAAVLLGYLMVSGAKLSRRTIDLAVSAALVFCLLLTLGITTVSIHI